VSVPGAFLTAAGLARLAWVGRYFRTERTREAVSMVRVMRIDRWDPRRDGALTAAALRQKIEALGYAVSTCDWPAGSVVGPVAHACERIDAVVSGIVKITIEEESAILTAGDLVFVPRGAVRRVEVVGTSPAQSFDAVYIGESRKF
jgi:mannose-6-phosphate isomerase-like protein (cupin superfamily)